MGLLPNSKIVRATLTNLGMVTPAGQTAKPTVPVTTAAPTQKQYTVARPSAPAIKAPQASLPTPQPTAAIATPAGYSATTISAPTKVTPSTAAAPAALTPAQGSVPSGDLVSGRLNQLLDQNSLYLQKAGLRGTQTAQRRGLLNSTMAIEAGQSAAIAAAAPIATADATILNQQRLTNQQNEQQAMLAEANLKQATEQFNAGLITNTELANAQRELQVARANQAASNRAAEVTASQSQQAELFNAAEQNKLAIQKYDAAFRTSIANLDAATRTQLANLDAAIRPQIQASASAASVYSNAMDAIASIMTSQSLNAASKTAAVRQVITEMNAANTFFGVAAKDPAIGQVQFTATPVV